MEKDAGFQYKVTMGDEDQVARNLAEAEQPRRNS